MQFDELKKIIVDTLACDEDKVTPEASLVDDLEIDSLSLVELHMALEDAVGKTIPDGEIGKLQTVEDILKYLNA
ncbi:acyl carrier protein [Oribacterium sp. HCP28S3_H8]|uniref:acyl carrier protein n=1 Tax=Oribacterium sp. HCP28S3_H8 TaxID=3438945 RepID=UPI003F88F2BE